LKSYIVFILHEKWKICTKFYKENLRERDNFGDEGTGGRIVLKWILETWGVRVWIGFN
jgi:hypothetical protein